MNKNKVMRLYIAIALLSVVASLSAANLTSACKVDSIIILHSNWDIETDIPIKSSQFYNIAKTKYSITDKKTIRRFQKELKSIKPIGNTIPNIRCKIYFFSNDSIIETICCSRWHILYNGQTYSYPKNLFSMINQITDTYHATNITLGEYHSHGNYLFDKTEYISQLLYNYFYSQYKCIPDELNKIYVVCNADINGNTLGVKFYDFPDCIKNSEENLKNLLVEKLKWNRNPERNPVEIYLLCIEFINDTIKIHQFD